MPVVKKSSTPQTPPHQKMVNRLVQSVFSGTLKPGDKLPTERALAEKHGIDRASLRIALKRLEAMGLLDIRPGDGMYVKDYLENAGLDFLAAVFAQTENGEGEPFAVDEYTVREVWEYWSEFFPAMLKFAAGRVAPRDIKKLTDIIDLERESVDDPARVVELNVLEQDLIALATNNLVFILLSNTSRPIRKRMVELFVSRADRETLLKHIELKKRFNEEYLSGAAEYSHVADKYSEVLKAHLHMVRPQPGDMDRLVESYRQAIKNTG